MGAVLDGLAAGLPVDEAAIAAAMDRRRARGDGLSTARTEADAVEFLSGVYEGHTTGTPIALMIRNLNTRSGDYAKTADLLRPVTPIIRPTQVRGLPGCPGRRTFFRTAHRRFGGGRCPV